jgi:hypothetical protein
VPGGESVAATSLNFYEQTGRNFLLLQAAFGVWSIPGQWEMQCMVFNSRRPAGEGVNDRTGNPNP